MYFLQIASYVDIKLPVTVYRISNRLAVVYGCNWVFLNIKKKLLTFLIIRLKLTFNDNV